MVRYISYFSPVYSESAYISAIASGEIILKRVSSQNLYRAEGALELPSQ